MDIKLLNKIIEDLPNKSIVSDGTFTLGELHKDRLSLYINLIDLLSVVYAAKGLNDIIWISLKDSEGKETEGYMHLGLFHSDPKLMMGAKVPLDLWDLFLSKSKILMSSPKYKPLVEVLPNYFYSNLNSEI